MTESIKSNSSEQPRRAVFLDRDGVIVRDAYYLRNPDGLDLLPGAGEAIRMLNEGGFLAIVVTNQSVVARGLCTEVVLKKIHDKMETLLERERARVDAIYYCPHHPDHAYRGQCRCDCRKPGTGLIDGACRDFNIAREASFLIGDTTTDIEAGRRAGLTPVLVRTGRSGQDRLFSLDSVDIFDDLLAAVKVLMRP